MKFWCSGGEFGKMLEIEKLYNFLVETREVEVQ